MNAELAFELCKNLGVSSVLNVGSGGVDLGFDCPVDTVDLKPPATFVGDFMSMDLQRYGLVWCSHVLEHQPNPNSFLKKCISHIEDDGYLAVTVPPLKHEIVGGHLTLWNAGLLLYNLIVAGLDCSKAKVKTYGYNISVVVKKSPIELPPLKYDNGDINTLAEFFPCSVTEGFDGRLCSVNWP